MHERISLYRDVLATLVILLAAVETRPQAWHRHTVDDSSRGADGVRLADANGDGLLDIVTGWEEGGAVRLCLHPGRDEVRSRWPGVMVGRAPNVEDAFMTDIDSDGAIDVISFCEGSTRTVFVHWGPRDAGQILDPSAWKTEAVPASTGRMMWMFGRMFETSNGERRLWAGGKGSGAELGWFDMGSNPRKLENWEWRGVRPLGWLMSLSAWDLAGDGEQNVVISDRRGPRSGVFWFDGRSGREERLIGGLGREVMFIDIYGSVANGDLRVIASVKPRDILIMKPSGNLAEAWKVEPVTMPEWAGTAKAVQAGDIEMDGRAELVVSCEGATNGKSGVLLFSESEKGEWIARDLSGPEGVKFDLVELIDLDGDGDLDVLTCEEADNLGVIWYENER